MLDHGEALFENMQDMMKKLKKATYEERMEAFLTRHETYLDGMIGQVAAGREREAAAAEAAERFTEQVRTAFSAKGKINSRTQADLNFFMIYYVFPAILLRAQKNAEEECGRMLADHIRDSWRVKFRDSSKLQYADYDKIHDSFREKIFGIF